MWNSLHSENLQIVGLEDDAGPATANATRKKGELTVYQSNENVASKVHSTC